MARAKKTTDDVKEVTVKMYEDSRGGQHTARADAEAQNRIYKFDNYFYGFISLDTFKYNDTSDDLMNFLLEHKGAILEFLGPTT